MINSLCEQLTLNLALGILFLLITLSVLLARTISSPANIRFAYARVQGSSPWRCTTYSSIAQSVERMTVNLPLGVISVLITPSVLLARTNSSLGNVS